VITVNASSVMNSHLIRPRTRSSGAPFEGMEVMYWKGALTIVLFILVVGPRCLGVWLEEMGLESRKVGSAGVGVVNYWVWSQRFQARNLR